MADFSLVQPSGTFDTPDYNTNQWQSGDTVNLVNGLFGQLGNVFSGIGNLVSSVNGQPQQINPVTGQPYNPYGPYNPYMQQPQPTQGISTGTIVIGFVLLLLIIAAVFLVAKSK